MKRTIIAAAVASLVTIAVAFAALAQSNALAGLLNPLIVKISQDVPVELTVATAQDDGSVITSTVPLTVGVDLAITIRGAHVVGVTAADTAVPQVGVAAHAASMPAIEPAADLVDNSGIPYTLEIADGFELVDLQTSTDVFGNLSMIGELRNMGSKDVYPRITVTLYNAAGKMLSVNTGAVTGGELGAGASGPFITLISTASDDVASYRLQIK